MVKTQCTNHSNVELLVDGQLWNSTILYQINNEHLVLGCRKCNTDTGIPNWFHSNETHIQPCDNISELQICTQTNGSIKALKFLPFKEAFAGEYRCNAELKIRIELGK